MGKGREEEGKSKEGRWGKENGGATQEVLPEPPRNIDFQKIHIYRNAFPGRSAIQPTKRKEPASFRHTTNQEKDEIQNGQWR